MWLEIHPELSVEIEAQRGENEAWIWRKLQTGEMVAFVARTPQGEIAGSGCIWLREEQPKPTAPGQVTPYLMSMYTEPGARKKGAASSVVEAAVEWCRRHGYPRVTLHSSDAGRKVYESLGFERTNEMRLALR
jgi:GNAT superfamily N-acetyltransferase